MNFQLGLIKTPNQISILSCQKNRDDSVSPVALKTMDLQELSEQNLQSIFVSSNINDEEIDAMLQEEGRFCPILKEEQIYSFATALNFQQNQFEKLNFEQAHQLLIKAQAPWILKNNLQLLEELFPVLDHLKKLWPNDRTTFFEELWFVLKSNLGTSDLTIIFNDIEINETHNKKNKLIRAKICGTKTPNPLPAEEIDEKLMEEYKKYFSNIFTFVDYIPEKGELVATATINNGPIIIMAHVQQLNSLQKTLVRTLFAGLN